VGAVTADAGPNPLATAEPWDLVARAYVDEALRHFLTYAGEALRLAAPPPGARVLDVACGPGTVSVLAASAGARVTAIDISEAMLVELRARAAAAGVAGAIDARLGDAQRLPFARATFDAAFSMFGLMFFPDRRAGLEEMRRVLVPGGRAVISSWVPFVGPFGELMQAVAEIIPGIPLGVGKQPLASPEEVRAELAAAGFHGVRVETLGHEIKASSFDKFWESIERTNAPLVLLRRRVGEARWADLAPKLRERVRAALGDGPVVVGRGAYLGLGVA
jgi:ubiquinone/menaquinone biosynthesis C-methylase UbiE